MATVRLVPASTYTNIQANIYTYQHLSGGIPPAVLELRKASFGLSMEEALPVAKPERAKLPKAGKLTQEELATLFGALEAI